MQVIMHTEDVQVDQLQQAVNRYLDDQFVMTASVEAIRQREVELGIQAVPIQESVDFRRKRIINRYSTKAPFTTRYLQQQLDYLFGKGRAIVNVDVTKFILMITTSVDDASLFKELDHTVKSVKPANMIYQQQTAVEDEIFLAEYIKKRDVFWNYKLDGSWKLGEQPFSTIGEEVVIK